MAIDSIYKLKTGEEVAYFPPIQNTDNPYATEAAMHADQANQLEGYGYLVDGAGAFTYLGTVAGTSADYEAFGGGSGADVRLSNVVSDLSGAEKTDILNKIGANAALANAASYIYQQIELQNEAGNADIWNHISYENTLTTSTGWVNTGGGVAGAAMIEGRSGIQCRPTMIAPFNCVIERVFIGGYGGYDYLISVGATTTDITNGVAYPNTFINPLEIFQMSFQAPSGSSSTYKEFVNANEVVITKGKAVFLCIKKSSGTLWQGLSLGFLLRKV